MVKLKKASPKKKVKPLENYIKTSTTAGIITHFKKNPKIVYCLIGFKSNHIMENLGLSYLLFYKTMHLNTLINSKALKHKLKGKKIVFLTSNFAEYKAFKWALKESKIKIKNLYLLDLEVLKSYIFIGFDELDKNDYEVSLNISGQGSFNDLVREIKFEFGFSDDKGLYSYIKEILKTYEKRLLKGKYENRNNDYI